VIDCSTDSAPLVPLIPLYAPRALGERTGFFVQEDNVAVEFNIPPAKTLAEWCESIGAIGHAIGVVRSLVLSSPH
jgi:hypothetical protein